jgi:hypothetical protein
MTIATDAYITSAPPATCTRVHWQPYHSIPSSTSSVTSQSPPPTYLSTPASSVMSSPPHGTPPLCKIKRLRQALPSSILQTPRDAQIHDTHKNKYAMALVCQPPTHRNHTTETLNCHHLSPLLHSLLLVLPCHQFHPLLPPSR